MPASAVFVPVAKAFEPFFKPWLLTLPLLSLTSSKPAFALLKPFASSCAPELTFLAPLFNVWAPEFNWLDADLTLFVPLYNFLAPLFALLTPETRALSNFL